MFKVVVAGSRGFNDYDLLHKKLAHYLCRYKPEDVEIVSGGAKGADLLGERFAKETGCSIKRFIPDWDAHGKSAGYLRNWEMAKYADACVVFWDGKSKGAKHMIDLAEKEGVILKKVMI
ncbi:DUF2493 domain-containing protein [Bacillus subtilis]|uniref:Uncharacterized protein n=1 Tax=Bacillus phage vB_BsuS_PJN02 TaxID=2920374 RepID=A0AC61TRZ2_9CAUD|nr:MULTISPECIES: DUF2493 domain-containing protein [Bacillus subtilis group]YP_010681731.1 hypothetical protein PQE76_gp113 [Bacillus phage vB_BsuS_PJN02]MCR4362039.1 DUF2493 domain-containing protein [Bacillus subtilis]UNH58456.1 hypothetical protein [Bacillus phage vB_BsuS_PJN02]UQB84345.1 DUF2493 domain-containing protein [Bacillus amyloliquefaciens]WOF32982.1 DUF2493 domain-containing protein [Bacillus subtilis]